MTSTYHNHTLQDSPWHDEKETQNIYSNDTAGRHEVKEKQPASLPSLPQYV